jgi:hypothetical protein
MADERAAAAASKSIFQHHSFGKYFALSIFFFVLAVVVAGVAYGR